MAPYSRNVGRPVVVERSNCSRVEVVSIALFILQVSARDSKGPPWRQERGQDFYWEGQNWRAEGRVRGWGFWGGVATPSAHQLGGLGSAVSCPSGVRGGAPTAQRFPLFQHSRMSSPDTIIWLIVDYYAAIGGQDPRDPSLRTPLHGDGAFECGD